MKRIFETLAVAAVALFAAACSITPEDAFSKDPAAPVLNEHDGILITEATSKEDVTFSWLKARFIDTDVTYEVSMTYNEKTSVIGQTTDCELTINKIAFKGLIAAAFPEIEPNSSFLLSIGVAAIVGSERYEADPITVSVYSYDVIAPIATSQFADADVVFSLGDAANQLTLIEWTAANYGYNGEISYDVMIQIGENEPYAIANGLTDFSYTASVAVLDEAFVQAGATLDEATEANVYVLAYNTNDDQVLSTNIIKMNVTTYDPPKGWSVIGDFNSWSADAIMTEIVPGVWVSEMLELTGGWKLRKDKSWDNNRGGDITAQGEFGKAVPNGNNINIAGTMKVVYYSDINVIGTLGWGITGSIASAGINWNSDIPMNLVTSGDNQGWWISYPVYLTSSDAVKLRYGAGWDKNYGGTFTSENDKIPAVAGGDNMSIEKDGWYTIWLNPEEEMIIFSDECIGLVGSYNGWGASQDIFMMNTGDAYEAYNMTIEGSWKFRCNCSWDKNWGSSLFEEYGVPFSAVRDGDNLEGIEGVDIKFVPDDTITFYEQ